MDAGIGKFLKVSLNYPKLYRSREIVLVLAFESICENAPKLGSHSLVEEGSSRAQTAGQENPFWILKKLFSSSYPAAGLSLIQPSNDFPIIRSIIREGNERPVCLEEK